MINLEEQIDKLKINDAPVEPIKQIDDESKTVVKSINADVSKDKPVTDKANEQQQPIKKEPTVSNSSISQQQQNDSNNVQQSKPASTSTTSKPQQQTSQTQQVSNDNKKSSLEGPQSKSTGNITYEIEFLKKFQYSNFSIEKPNFGNL